MTSCDCHCACDPIRRSGVLTSSLAFSRQSCQQRQLSNWQGKLSKGVLTKGYCTWVEHMSSCTIPYISKDYYSLHTQQHQWTSTIATDIPHISSCHIRISAWGCHGRVRLRWLSKRPKMSGGLAVAPQLEACNWSILWVSLSNFSIIYLLSYSFIFRRTLHVWVAW